MIAAGAHLSFAASADHVARAILIRAKERTSPMDAFLLAGLKRVERDIRPLWVVRKTTLLSQLRVIVGPIPIAAPFPDVAADVVQAVAIWRELRHGCDA